MADIDDSPQPSVRFDLESIVIPTDPSGDNRPAVPPLISEPIPGSIYSFDSAQQTWEPHVRAASSESQKPIASLTILTWNVDFVTADPPKRLEAALSYIKDLHDGSSAPPIPPIILLQELDHKCFDAILNNAFVREQYSISDTTHKSWAHDYSSYGTITLVPSSILENVHQVFRCRLKSNMNRDVLCVDISISVERDPTDDPKIIRIANVHLESLRGAGDSARMRQMAAVKTILSPPEVYAGIVAGDMNPIGPLDPFLPDQQGLIDAWEACHGKTTDSEAYENKAEEIFELKEDPEGHTWGYQPSSRFLARRMDKILLHGNLKARSVEVIGKGLKVNVWDDYEEAEADVWVSDHYALLATIDTM